jgi:hypothetical protein
MLSIVWLGLPFRAVASLPARKRIMTHVICNLHRCEGQGLRGRLPGGLHPRRRPIRSSTSSELPSTARCAGCLPVSAIFALEDVPEQWKGFVNNRLLLQGGGGQ